jgi:hypothetical protein
MMGGVPCWSSSSLKTVPALVSGGGSDVLGVRGCPNSNGWTGVCTIMAFLGRLGKFRWAGDGEGEDSMSLVMAGTCLFLLKREKQNQARMAREMTTTGTATPMATWTPTDMP